MTPLSNAFAPTSHISEGEFSLTAGVLAMINLQAQIDGQERQVMAGRLATVSDRAELIELVALRGQILGHISDYEWAEERAVLLTRDEPADGIAFIARARAQSRFHRFTDALADLDQAQQLGASPAVVDPERACVFQAIGRYEPALTIYSETVKRRGDFTSFGALATLHSERGEVATAERLFDKSRSCYRGVSPFPLAQLDFQRGLMWLAQGDLRRAHTWFYTAVRLLPAYAAAEGHMAELEAVLGAPEAAIARLHSLVTSSEDPDYAASLARILQEVGRVDEADAWSNKAAARYEQLLARHPEAFADHAAEFWLEAGADPHRALELAKLNLDVRQTPRARELLSRAIVATGGDGTL